MGYCASASEWIVCQGIMYMMSSSFLRRGFLAVACVDREGRGIEMKVRRCS
jgi:hypothetical protein